MKLPNSLANSKEWTITGPMGPALPEALLTHSILCVDGGSHFCPRMDVWVGDGDSGPSAVKCDNIYQFSPHKSSSDLALALTLFENSSDLTLHCWGFLGGRRDHELINFGEIMSFLEGKPGSQAFFYNQQGELAVHCFGQGSWNLQHQGLFSLASLKNVKVTMTGSIEYEIKSETELQPFSSLGLSNSAQGTFNLQNQGPVMVIFPEIT